MHVGQLGELLRLSARADRLRHWMRYLLSSWFRTWGRCLERPLHPGVGKGWLLFPGMKIVIWSFLTLFFAVCAIGGLLSAVQGQDASTVIRHLGASAMFSSCAWGSWQKASRPRIPAWLEEPRRRPWRRP